MYDIYLLMFSACMIDFARQFFIGVLVLYYTQVCSNLGSNPWRFQQRGPRIGIGPYVLTQ